jgi:uncharacterized protein
MDEKELKDRMLRQSDAFRKLNHEHQQLEKKLERFKAKAFLTEEERLEERLIKKRKLALKDRMYLMMSELRKTG